MTLPLRPRNMIMSDSTNAAVMGHVHASPPRAEGPWADLALHSIGWKAFQDLCSQVCEVVLQRPVEIYREAQDGGQDAVFLTTTKANDPSAAGSIQVKHSTDPAKKLRLNDLTPELEHVKE